MEKYIFNEMIDLETNHWWYHARRDIISQVLNINFKGRKNLNILDVGCGTGSNIKLLKKFGRVLGLEPEKSMAEYCQKNELKVVNCTIEDYQKSREFNLITAFDVLEHIKDDRQIIQKFASLLNKDGYFLITMPAKKLLWTRHDAVCHHYRRYEAPDIKNLVQDDFKVVYISYYNFFLFPLIFIGLKVKNILKSDQMAAKLPNKFTNWLLYKIFSSEKKIIRRRKKFPFGVSLIVLAQKNG